MMIAQLDLFAAPAPSIPPAPAIVRAPLADIIPRAPSVAWERLLRQHPDIATTVIVTCGDRCTGVIIETLLLGPERNYWLTSDHPRHPLIRVKTGTHAGFYRLAAEGEIAPSDLEVPPATIGPEMA